MTEIFTDHRIAYLPGDSDVPSKKIDELTNYCRKKNLQLIVACDANAHHMGQHG